MNLSKHTTSEMEMFVRSEVRGDVLTCHEVQERDVYRVKKLAAEGFKPKVIVDIGGHIATFTALAAKYWPEARIFIFEPSNSFPCLSANLPPNARAMNCAVLGYAGYEGERVLSPSHGDEQRWRDERRCVSFKQVLELAGGKIDFLKIDCEQSEVNILREMNELGVIANIEVIHGEWHLPIARELVKDLLRLTHELEIVEGHDMWDMFWARRKENIAPRTLVFTLAYGEEARRQAELMVRSVREFGRYRGEIRVYSDSPDAIPGADVWHNTDISALPKPHLGKAFLGKRADFHTYDQVMFLDADIVAVEPIAPFLRVSKMSAPVELKIGLDADRYFSLGPVAIGTPGFNSGTLTGPGSEWSIFCQHWWNEMVRRRVWESQTSIDQATLNHLHQIGVLNIAPLPDGWVRFMHAQLEQCQRSKLIHMRGPHKIALMKSFIGMTQAAPPVTMADAADRCSILRLKLERLGEQPDVREEFRVMAAACDGIDFTSLYEINGKIWDLESDIRRGKEGELGLEEVGRRALAIRDLNAQRIAVKNSIAARHGATTEIKGNHASQ